MASRGPIYPPRNDSLSIGNKFVSAGLTECDIGSPFPVPVSPLLESHQSPRNSSRGSQYRADADADHSVIEQDLQRNLALGDSLEESRRTKDSSAIDSALAAYWKGNPWHSFVWDILGFVVALCFLVLGVCVAKLNGKPETAWSKHVIQATKVAPSIWPILFSGLLGNAIRTFADWRAEIGVTLLDLEQLMGSLTMASSVITIFKWSIFKLSSTVLVFLWAFNPLGSQASFRGIHLTDSVGYSTGTVTYYNHNLTDQLGMTIFSTSTNRARPAVRALYSAALYDIVSSTQNVNKSSSAYKELSTRLGGPQSAAVQAAMDSWGNVRIPNINYLPEYDKDDPYKWISIPWMEAGQDYTSLIGDRVEGVARNFTGNSTFNITSSFQSFRCSSWIKLNQSETNEWCLVNLGRNYTAALGLGESRYCGSAPAQTFLVTSPDYGGIPLVNRSSDYHPKLVFGTRGENNFFSVTTCELGTIYVDAQVKCISRGTLGQANCGVESIREMQGPALPPEINILESVRVPFPNSNITHDPNIPYIFFRGFMSLLGDAQIGSGQSSIEEFYLQDPMSAFTSVSNTYTELGNLDITIFEKRLALLYNTLWKASWSYSSATGGNIKAPRYYTYDPLLNTTSTVILPLVPVYAINVPWMVVYFVSVTVMLVATAFSVAVHARCRAPPILGYVSSMIRDSKYFDDPSIQGLSTEDRITTVERLKKLSVIVGDVKGTEDVGKIAFARDSLGVRVRKNRLYE